MTSFTWFCVVVAVCAVVSVLGARRKNVCNVVDYGAKGDNETLDTSAFVNALAACGAGEGGGMVVVPEPGVYRLGALNITQNNIVFRVEPNAVMSFYPDFSLYPRIPHLPSYPCDRDQCKPERFNPCLLIYKAQNVTVTGGGKLDGNGWWWWPQYNTSKLPAGRPRLFSTMYSKNVVISHLHLFNSPFWTLHLWASDNIEVGHIEVWAPRDSHNTDGVDPDSSSNVWIHHILVQNGDDGIAVKSGMNAAGRAFGRPTTNVLVEHSSFLISDGLSVGSEISGGVENVTFRHNKVGPFGSAAYVKTAPARGGYVKNVTWSDIDTVEPGPNLMIRIQTNYGGDNATSPSMTVIEDLSFVRMQGPAQKAGHILCTHKIPCNDLTFDRVVVDHAQKEYVCNGTITGTQRECRPPVSCVP